MRKIIMLFSIITIKSIVIHAQCPHDSTILFKAGQHQLMIWNKNEYIPFFVKGINLGVSLPGKHPGELEVSRNQYGRWFKLIKDAGFNTIRLYTLHFPHFYEVLDSFNLQNKENPLLFLQGVWMEEEFTGFSGDLYDLNNVFLQEIEDNINCVHGNNIIAPRLGKAYGTYYTNVSKWNLGYIIGRETFPNEVLITNENHPMDTSFIGNYFSIVGSPSENWIVKKLDYLVSYEFNNYQTQRPVSFSSWPTLDPLPHLAEPHRDEDTAVVDLSNINVDNAPAGFFISYHSYPYYPDFISDENTYQNYADEYGLNSYLGYITKLKEHYSNFPLLIAETGVPSSWGIAHYSSNGMHHGGFNQINQGITNLRLIKNAIEANCAGSVLFSWMDEWFKRTWITDPLDYLPDRRILWHNLGSAEQNFGLIGFQKETNWQLLTEFNDTMKIKKIYAAADFDFLQISIKLSNTINQPDEIWIGIDTYSDQLGESKLPNKDSMECRSEFALKINNFSAQLFVTQAYDMFGVWHNVSPPEQLYHSISSDGGNWNIVKWKNNQEYESIQYIGNLKVNLSFLPESSDDAVTIFNDSMLIRIPWSLLHFVDPSELRVIHDYRSTSTKEDTVSSGIKFHISYQDKKVLSSNRFVWDTWNVATPAQEYLKSSYFVIKDGLKNINNPAIAYADSFTSSTIFPFNVNQENGILKNDIDLDGNEFQAVLISNASHGYVNLNFDGSFSYQSINDYNGYDSFTYCIFDGRSLSNPANVCLRVIGSSGIKSDASKNSLIGSLQLFPNPTTDVIVAKSKLKMQSIAVFNSNGALIIEKNVDAYETNIDLSNLSSNTYFVKVTINHQNLLYPVYLQK